MSEEAEDFSRRRGFDQNLHKSGGLKANRVVEDVPQCWFCDTKTGKQTKEHAFPQALLRHYNAENELVSPHRRDFMGRLASDRGTFPIKSLTCGEVCADCNNGWMSQLEADAFPLLANIPTTGEIEFEERLLLTRWFVKTAVVLNVSQPYRLLVPQHVRNSLHDTVGGFRVQLHRMASSNGYFDWVQGVGCGLLVESANAATRYAETVLVTRIRVDTLVATVWYLPAPYDPTNVMTFPEDAVIWPGPATVPRWDSLPELPSLLEPAGTIDLVRRRG